MDVSDLQLRRSYVPEQVMQRTPTAPSIKLLSDLLPFDQAYGNSKAAQIMFGEHLAREVDSRGGNVKIIR